MIPMLPHPVAVIFVLLASLEGPRGELATPRLEGRVTDLAHVLSPGSLEDEGARILQVYC
jgi:hypothetical protein